MKDAQSSIENEFMLECSYVFFIFINFLFFVKEFSKIKEFLNSKYDRDVNDMTFSYENYFFMVTFHHRFDLLSIKENEDSFVKKINSLESVKNLIFDLGAK